MDEMRVAAQKECLGVRCEELSLRYYERCSVFYGIPAAERDDAVRMIQRSLRACTAWRHNTTLKTLAAKNKEIWGFGRGEARSDVLDTMRRAALDCGFLIYGQTESYTDLGNAEMLALDADSADQVRANKVCVWVCVCDRERGGVRANVYEMCVKYVV